MPLMAIFIWTQGTLYDRRFTATAELQPRTSWLGRVLDKIDTNLEVTFRFKDRVTHEQLLAVNNVVGKHFGHKKIAIDGEVIRLRMNRSEFCHPRNRHFLKQIITSALIDERPRGLRAA